MTVKASAKKNADSYAKEGNDKTDKHKFWEWGGSTYYDTSIIVPSPRCDIVSLPNELIDEWIDNQSCNRYEYVRIVHGITFNGLSRH